MGTDTLMVEVQDLRERLRVAEEKLLDAQSMRDMFAKEVEMYRSELKIAREDRKQMEDLLSHTQERVSELQALQVRSDPTDSTRHEVVIQSMQKISRVV